jgi:hypothetical protein
MVSLQALGMVTGLVAKVPPNGPCACFGCGKRESHQREFKRCAYCPTATYCSRCGCGGEGVWVARGPLLAR